MPNIIITSTTNTIKLHFGDYTEFGAVSRTIPKDKVLNIDQLSNMVVVYTKIGYYHFCKVTTDNANIVDTVDGVVPDSVADLKTKLDALL